MSVLISCEAGGQHVPAWLVSPSKNTKTSPTPFDGTKKFHAGKLPMQIPNDMAADYIARRMAKNIGVSLVRNVFSHQLIDVTRSLHHRQLFPIATRSWSNERKQRLISEIYAPYRESLSRTIGGMLQRHPYVIHLSIRTFDSNHQKKPRRADVGLLYDPAIENEVDFCLDWIDELYDDAPMLKVRRNYPRRGTNDSITKAMRTEFSGQNYMGIEVLLNRAWSDRAVSLRDEAIDAMSNTLEKVIRMAQSEAA